MADAGGTLGIFLGFSFLGTFESFVVKALEGKQKSKKNKKDKKVNESQKNKVITKWMSK